MNKTICLATLLLSTAAVMAEEPENHNWLHTAQLEVRIDWQRDQLGCQKIDDNSGFKGQ